jgi:hypothetical protein
MPRVGDGSVNNPIIIDDAGGIACRNRTSVGQSHSVGLEGGLFAGCLQKLWQAVMNSGKAGGGKSAGRWMDGGR